MAEPTVVANSMNEALMANASVVSMSNTTTASLSSSSSCMSSSSPTSSFGSTGTTGSIGGDTSSSMQQQVITSKIDSLKCPESENADDSTTNMNTASTTTPSTGNNCNSSGEPVSSDGDNRNSAEDLISHLNMLSMQDGLGFNGFGLLGTGGGGEANAWATGLPSSIGAVGNGIKQSSNLSNVQDHQSLGVANYIEALKLQQQLQLQQLKSNDLLANFFNTSPQSNNGANYFGAPIAQNPHFRRPIFGSAGTGNENVYAAPYNNFFMNRPAPGIHFPPPLDFGGHGRGGGKPYQSGSSYPLINNESNGRTLPQARVNGPTLNQQQPPSATVSSSLFNLRNQVNGSNPLFASTPAPPFGGKNAPYGGGLRFEQYKSSMPQQQLPQAKGAPFLPPPLLQQQQLRRGANSSLSYNGNNRTMFGNGPFRSSASDVSSLSSGAASAQIFSRKVFVGGLPPDIDEAIFKRPSSALGYSKAPAMHSPSSPSNMNLVMIPSNVAVTGLVTPPIGSPMVNSQTNRQQVQQQRPSRNASGPEVFSRKVFVGGLPMDISEGEIVEAFNKFGTLTVDWPHKAESKSYFPPKGYAFLIFHYDSSVQTLIETCSQQDGRYYYYVSSPTVTDKPVQIRPWRLADADFVLDPLLPLDPRKTVFVGGVPRPLKAVELASILERLFGGVCYTGIDTDPELKYPKGAGRVSFSNQQSYIAAISARFVQLQHGDIDKRVEIKPYVLDDQMCDECGGARCAGKYAPYFCANVGCLQYYCDLCWQHIHSKAGREFHKPLVKEGTDRPRAIPYKWGM